jgi:hypothetical protein
MFAIFCNKDPNLKSDIDVDPIDVLLYHGILKARRPATTSSRPFSCHLCDILFAPTLYLNHYLSVNQSEYQKHWQG